MGSLIFNFIKRALIVPTVITVLVIVAAFSYLNPAAAASQAKLEPKTAQELDLSGYTSSLYESFSELQEGDFIGTLSGEDFGLFETAVCYNTDSRLNVSVAEASTTPWETGALLLVGSDTATQLNALHNAVIGDVLTLDITGKGVYTYTITRIDTAVSQEQLDDYYTDGTLAVAMPYKNFSSVTAEDDYIVFSAEQA